MDAPGLAALLQAADVAAEVPAASKEQGAEISAWAEGLSRAAGDGGRALLSAAREAARALADGLADDDDAALRERAVAARDALVAAVPAEDRSPYRFTTSWFADAPMQAWGPRTRHLRGAAFRALEIGSFEGASTTYILDELMTHPDSRLTAVDTFGGAMDHQPRPNGPDYQLDGLFGRYSDNVARSAHAHQLRTLRMSSIEGAILLRSEGATFDFIYIDGSHTAADVLHDAVTLWPMLAVGGTLVFDDVDWSLYKQEYYNPGVAIYSFLRCHRPEVRFVKDTGQMWVTRVANHDAPEQAFEWGDEG